MRAWHLRILIAFILALAIKNLGLAATGEVATAEDFCRQAADFAKQKQGKIRYFGNMASMEQEAKDDWRGFRTAKERDKATTDDNLFETADVTLRDGKVLLVKFMFTSPSGDWAHYIDACYRTDGTLARAVAELRTFNGNMRVVRTIYFSTKGRESKSQTSYFDLDNGKKKQPTQGSFLDQEPTLFLKTAELPFSRLLSLRGASGH